MNLSKLNQKPFLDSVVFFPLHFFLVPFGHMTCDVSLVSYDNHGHVSYYLSHNRWDLYYTWAEMLLQIGPFYAWVQNVFMYRTFIMLGSKCYYRWDLYYTWVQLLHLCLLQASTRSKKNSLKCLSKLSCWFRHLLKEIHSLRAWQLHSWLSI